MKAEEPWVGRIFFLLCPWKVTYCFSLAFRNLPLLVWAVKVSCASVHVESPVWGHAQTSVALICSVKKHRSPNTMSFGILSVNAIANFVHTVGFIWVMQFGFKRLTEKHESAESITSICLKSNPLKQWNAIYFSGREVLCLSLFNPTICPARYRLLWIFL